MEDFKQMQKDYVLQSWSKQKNINPLMIKETKGIYLYDFEGNRYSDMSAQLVNMNIGHGNQKVIDAICKQAQEYAFIAPSYGSIPRAKLAKKIIELMPESFGKVFFTNGGADANENAIKIAKMYTQRFKVFSRYRSYHGSTFGAGNATGEPRRFALEPGIPGFVKFFDPYIYREPVEFKSEEEATKYYLTKLREQIVYEGGETVAAILLETVTGSNGVIIPPAGYLPGVRKICDEFGILMICDEVMAGWGRTGKMFAFENFDVVPDIVTFAKGVTCGYVQLGGVAVSKKIAGFFDDNMLSCGLTYSGHPIACAAGLATIDVYREENILENVAKVGAVLKEELLAMKDDFSCVGDVRSIGLFGAIELVKDKATKEPLVSYNNDRGAIMPKIIGMLKQRGFMTYSHENMIFVTPPLIITQDQLLEELEKVKEVLEIVDKEMI